MNTFKNSTSRLGELSVYAFLIKNNIFAVNKPVIITVYEGNLGKNIYRCIDYIQVY